MKYNIGDIIVNTEAFGTVEVKDVFTSSSGQYCYLIVTVENGEPYLCWEADLNAEQLK